MALLAAAGVSARHLSADEALARIPASDKRHAPAALLQAPKLVYSAKAADAERVYVFGNASGKGFMVLSGDDCAPALLGYSETGTIDRDHMPDNMRYWFDEYARQIAFAAAGGADTEDPQVKYRPDVAPKLTTLWDQTEPYNDMTPVHYGLPTPTGCVATAAAQIMNWHKWPVQPVGTKTFQSYYIGTLSIDFSQITFEWDKMLDRYYTTSPRENINAVATLMMAAGYASEMVYHRNASGATGYNAARGLFTHFGYNKSMSLESREWYDIEEWDDLVYAELTENGPVFYEGTGDGGGHAFVCDGYESASGFFHFNWGWSGNGNGYYRLSALTPEIQGTGGNSLGYNYTQDILRGLRKSDPAADEQPVLMFSTIKGVVTPWDKAELGSPVTIKGYETGDGFKNSSLVTVKDVDMGVRIHNVATGRDIDVCSENGTNDFDPFTKVNIIRYKLPADLEEGDYTAVPLWRSGADGAWHTMRMSPQTRNYVPFTVSGTTAVFGLGVAEGRVEVEITDAPEFFTTYGDFTIRATVKSTGTRDFNGLLCAVFMRKNAKGELDVVDQGASERIDLEPGRTMEWTHSSKPQSGYMTDGDDYGLAIGNANTGELLSPIYAVKVGNRYGKLQMSVYDYAIANNTFLDPANVNATANVKVVSGEYDGPLAVGYSLKRDPFAPVRFTESETMHLTAGDDKPISFSGILDDVVAGEMYYAHLMYKNDAGEWTRLSQYPVTVIVAQTFSGINDVEAAEGADAARYFDIYGREVARPEAGRLYIRKTPDGKATKVVR